MGWETLTLHHPPSCHPYHLLLSHNARAEAHKQVQTHQTTGQVLPLALITQSLNIYSFFRVLCVVPLSKFVRACRGGWEEADGCVPGPLLLWGLSGWVEMESTLRPRPLRFPRLAMNEPRALMEASEAQDSPCSGCKLSNAG